MSAILVTGACGYIGAHTVIDLYERGYEPIIVDNLSRSDKRVLAQLKKITGNSFTFYETDARNTQHLRDIIRTHDIKGIIHFAAYKAVGESVAQPLLYYQNNIHSLLSVVECVREAQIPHFIFSSSCTVYGQAEKLPVTESSPLLPPLSPYGASKQMCERIITDFYTAAPSISCVILRYFNPAGAHHSGLIGELPIGVPQNLVPAITQSALGKIPPLKVFGTDYPTRDGSCLRDYIHIEDLARAHTLSLQYLEKGQAAEPINIFNIGTGEGISVLEAIHAFEEASGHKLAYVKAERRPGDIAAVYADNKKAVTLLGWQARYRIQDMMRSAWQWEQYLQKDAWDT